MKVEKGYVSLPCFTVDLINGYEPQLTCNDFLAWVWETFLLHSGKAKS